jgi:hypothetical protein
MSRRPFESHLLGAETMTVDAIGVGTSARLRLAGIDLLKIDIGDLVGVFSSGSQDWLERVQVIAIELHDRIRPGCTEALRQSLRGHIHSLFQSGEYTIIEMGQLRTRNTMHMPGLS